MPISLVCDSCAARLKVGDHLAGRKTRCPKCNAICTVPAGAVPDEEEAVAAVVKPGRKPRPEAENGDDDRPARKSRGRDEDEERPTRKARSRDEEVRDDDEDRPARKARSRDEDDDEDDREARPSRRSRRDEEDEDGRRSRKPRKKKKRSGGGGTGKLLLILLLVGGGLVLVLGVGGAVLYFLLAGNPRVTKENFDKIKIEMTQADVEKILGSGSVATEDDVRKAFNVPGSNDSFNKDNNFKWQANVRVFKWKNGNKTIFVQFGGSFTGKQDVVTEAVYVVTANDGYDADILTLIGKISISQHAGKTNIK